MSDTIDERIVEMRFDNKDFQRNVKDTIGSLQELETALALENGTKGIEKFNSALKDVGSNGSKQVGLIGTAIEDVSVKAIAKIELVKRYFNQLIDAGEKLVKSLSIDNVASGWNKFAESSTAVGTLVSQGFDLSTVEEQMDRLMWFTDETSYNFVDMQQNIGKFTAAGKGLEDSVTAMEGIANWAAMSGANAQKASSAMYQLSQAMSKGVLKYDDWKSIQNVGMDNRQFRKKALEYAEINKTVQKTADGLYKVSGKLYTIDQLFSSEGMSKAAWFTSDVMMDTFKAYSSAVEEIRKYAEENGVTASEAISALGYELDEFGLKAFKAAQEARTWGDVVSSVKDAVSSKWMDTFKLIFGNYEEAKNLWTKLANELYDVFAEGGNRRNEILKIWKDADGRLHLLNSFWNVFYNIKNILGAIREGIIRIFDPFHSIELSGNKLVNLTAKLELLTTKLFLNKDQLKTISDIVAGIAAPVKMIIDLLGTGFKLVSPFIPIVINFVSGIAAVIGRILEKVVALRDAIMQSETFRTIMDSLYTIFSKIGDSILFIMNNIDRLWGRLAEIPWLSSAINALGCGFESLGNYIGIAFKALADGLEWLSKVDFVGALNDWINGIGAVDFSESMGMMPETVQEGAKIIIEKLNWVKDKLVDAWGSILNFFKNLDIIGALSFVWDKVVFVFGKIGEGLSAFGVALYEGAQKIGLGGLALIATVTTVILAVIKVMKLMSTATKTLTSMHKMMDSFGYMARSIGKAVDKNFIRQTDSFGTTVLKIAAALAILTASLWAISQIPKDDLIKGGIAIGAIAVSLSVLVGVLASVSKLKPDQKMVNLGMAFIGVASAVLAVLLAIKVISDMDPISMITGFIAVINIFASLAAAIILTSKFAKDGTKCAGMLLSFAISLNITMWAVKSLAGMPFLDMIKGLGGLVALLGVIILASKAMKNMSFSAGAGLLLMAAGIVALEKALIWIASGGLRLSTFLTNIDAYVTIIVALGALMFAANLAGKSALSAGANAILLSVAMMGIASVMETLGKLSNADLERAEEAVVLLSAVLAGLIYVTKMTQNAKTSALFGITAALLALTADLAILSLFSWDAILKGIVSVGALMGSLALVVSVMDKTSNAKLAPMLTAAAIVTVLSIIAYELSKLDPVNLAASSVSLSLLTVSFGLLTRLVSKSQGLTKNGLQKAGNILLLTLSLVEIAGAIGILLHVINRYNISWGTVLAASAGIGAVLVSLVPLVKTIQGSNFGSGSTGKVANILLLCVSLSEIAVAIGLMAGVLSKTGTKATTIIASAAAMSAVLIAVAGAAKVISTISTGSLTNNKIGKILLLCLSLVEVAGAIILLNQFAGDWNSVVAAAIGLSTCLTALSGCFVLISNFVKDEGLLGKIGNFLLLGVSLAEIATVLVGLTRFGGDLSYAKEVLEGMSLCLTAMSASLVMISNFGNAAKALGNVGALLLLGVSLAELAGIMIGMNYLAKDADWDNLSNVLLKMTGIIAILSAVSILLGAVGSMSLAVLAGSLVVAAVIAVLGAIMIGIGWLASQEFMSGAETFLNKGADLMVGVAEALGRVAGAFIGGFSAEALKPFVEVGEYLSAFANAISGINDDTVGKLAVLSACVEMLVSASFLDTFNKLITLDLDNGGIKGFATLLPFLGKSVGDFSKYIEVLSDKDIGRTKNAAEVLSTLLSGLPKVGGAGSIFTGSVDLDLLSKELPVFVGSIIAFKEALGANPITEQDLARSAKAAYMVKQFNSDMPQSGYSVWGVLAGMTNLSTLGQNLYDFGMGLSLFAFTIGSEAGKYINETTKARLELVIPLIKDFNEGLPQSGYSVWGVLAGMTNLGDLGYNLRDLGIGIAKFCEAIGNEESAKYINKATADKVQPFISIMKQLSEDLPDTGFSFKKLFNGGTNITELSDDLYNLAMGIAVFSKIINEQGGLSADALKGVARCTVVLKLLSDDMPETSNGIMGMMFGGTDLGVLGSQLVSLAKGINGFCSALNENGGISEDAYGKAVNCVKILRMLSVGMPETFGGLSGLMFGGTNLGILGEQLKSIGSGISSFVTELNAGEPITEDAVQSAAMCVALLRVISNGSIKTDGGLLGLINGETNLGDLGLQLTKLGTGMASFSNAVSDINASNVEKAIECIGKLITLAKSTDGVNVSALNAILSSLGANGLKAFVEGFSSLAINDDIKPSIETFLSSIIYILAGDEALNKFFVSGQNCVNNFISGIKSLYSDLEISGKNIIWYYTQGIRNGIDSYAHLISDSGKDLGTALDNAVRDRLGIHSPSVAGSLIGSFYVSGIKLGLTSSSSKNSITTSANTLSNLLTNTMQTSAVNATSTLVTRAGNAIKKTVNSQKDTFKSTGNTIGTAINGGVTGKLSTLDVANPIKGSIASSLPTLKTYCSSFGMDLGTQVVNGFASKTSAIFNKVGASYPVTNGSGSKGYGIPSSVPSSNVSNSSRSIDDSKEYLNALAEANKKLDDTESKLKDSKSTLDELIDGVTGLGEAAAKAVKDKFGIDIGEVIDTYLPKLGISSITKLLDDMSVSNLVSELEHVLPTDGLSNIEDTVSNLTDGVGSLGSAASDAGSKASKAASETSEAVEKLAREFNEIDPNDIIDLDTNLIRTMYDAKRALFETDEFKNADGTFDVQKQLIAAQSMVSKFAVELYEAKTSISQQYTDLKAVVGSTLDKGAKKLWEHGYTVKEIADVYETSSEEVLAKLGMTSKQYKKLLAENNKKLLETGDVVDLTEEEIELKLQNASEKSEETSESINESIDKTVTKATEAKDTVDDLLDANGEKLKLYTKDTIYNFEAVQSSLVDFKNSFKDALSNHLDLFAAVDRDTESLAKKEEERANWITGSQKLEDMNTNLYNIAVYNQKLEEMKKKVEEAGGSISQGFWQKILSYSPDSEDFNAFYSMTADELLQANGLFTAQDIILEGLANQFTVDLATTGKASKEAFFKEFTEEESYQIMEAWARKGLEGVKEVLGINRKDSSEFSAYGKAVVEGLKQGIEDNQVQSDTVMATLGGAVESNFTDNGGSYGNFYSHGSNIVNGIVDGINNSLERAKEAAAELASVVNGAFTLAEQIHSPSKVFEKYGSYIDQGLANGIKKYSKVAYLATEEMAEGTNEAMRGCISAVVVDDMDLTPVIMPRLDLSNVSSGVSQISRMFGDQKLQATLDAEGSSSNGATNNSYTFNQYNTSPKALSRTEIYRQTKNQFSSFKGQVSRA